MKQPTGTVTFLFSDIEESTRLLTKLGAERYGMVLEEHRRLIRAALSQHAGFEVGTEGDSFFVAFHRAQDAVRAATDAQRALASHSWPKGRPVRVRMGIHTCEATASADGYVGIGVHRAARICAAAHGGQVVLSHTTHDLLEEDSGFAMLDLGEHRLKDLTHPQRLFQLLDPALTREFPPLRTLGNGATNLPVQPTPFVGRARELTEIDELLRRDDVRLLTLTGPGGTGKTRLALQAAAGLVERFPDGVFFVALAPLTDPALVMPAVAQAVGVNEAAGQSFAAYVATKSLLLVVDNVEQVVSAAPQLAQLLALAPQVKLLATSREPLRVAAEKVYPVPPLQLPDSRHLPDAASLSQYEAVTFFVERARAALPSFAVTTENAQAVAEICVRLDGLPLALELAAARISLLSPEAMVKRMGDRLKLLTSGARDLPVRQQTLRDTLAWSYDLLADDERQLFARVGVFAGGFTLEAAEAVCDADLDTLASLVDKSLVRRDGGRFGMLETIREYALERLAAGGEEDAVRGRHATFFEALAERAHAERFESEATGLEELEREHDNLRAALEWLGRRDPRRRLRLAGALGWFWHLHSHFSEGRARLSDALAGTSERDEVRARALTAAGELAAWAGDLVGARRLIDEAVSIWRELGRLQEVALALHELGWGYFFSGDDPAARRCMEASLELQQSAGEPFLVNRARIGLLQVLVSLGELETVERLAPEALDLAQRLGDRRAEHFAHHFLADCALIRGDFEIAESRYRRALELAFELGDRSETAAEIQGLAMAAVGRSRPRRALRLAGAAQAAHDALGIDTSGIRFWNDLQERFFGRARAEVGTQAADAAWQEGQCMAFERAIEAALAVEELERTTASNPGRPTG